MAKFMKRISYIIEFRPTMGGGGVINVKKNSRSIFSQIVDKDSDFLGENSLLIMGDSNTEILGQIFVISKG